MTEIVHPRRREAFLWLSATGLMLSGCAALNRPDPPQLYVLRPELAAASGAPVRWRLSVAIPDAMASLDTQRIALSHTPTTMDYFANAVWADRVPLLMQRLLIQAFDNSGRIVAVGRDTSGLENDYLLELEIRDFHARYTQGGTPAIFVGVQVKLVKMPDRDISGSVYVSEQSPADSNTLDSIVTAFNRASGAAISKIVGWTLSQPGPAGA